MPPDVSVVIPTYNRRGFLEEAIESCFAGNEALDVEVVVVDDGSTDGTREWLRQLGDERVRSVFQEHQGAQVARNRGMDEAKGNFIKFLDDDDWLASGALVEQVRQIRRVEADVCYGDLRMESSGDEAAQVFQQSGDRNLACGIFRESIWTQPFGLLYRRQALEGMEWNPALPYHQDYAFALNVACQGATAAKIDRVVGTIRQHGGPRIGNTKKAASRAEYYTLKVQLIADGIQRLEEQNALQSHHRRAAADGIWNWAHIIAAYDLDTFDDLYREVEGLVPGYLPERTSRVMSRLDATWGPRTTEKLTFPLRRAKAKCERVFGA